jgi:hypothetical protein
LYLTHHVKTISLPFREDFIVNKVKRVKETRRKQHRKRCLSYLRRVNHADLIRPTIVFVCSVDPRRL